MGWVMVSLLWLQVEVKANKPKVQSETEGKDQATTKNYHYRQQGQSAAGTASSPIAGTVFATFYWS
jgi:hypothetical protein